MPKKKEYKATINVTGTEVTVTSSGNNNDYISITDMTKGFEGGSALIEQWQADMVEHMLIRILLLNLAHGLVQNLNFI